MSLIFRATGSSIPVFAGHAIKMYPSFISYDHISQMFWVCLAQRNVEGMWQCQIGMVSERIMVCAVSTLQQAFSFWRLPWRILWTVPSDSARSEEISCWQICCSAFTIFLTADMFSLFEYISSRPRGVAIFFPLFSDQNKPRHLLMVGCEKALVSTAFVTFFLWIFSVISPETETNDCVQTQYFSNHFHQMISSHNFSPLFFH